MTGVGYFVGVGGQKCGTSWLARYLWRHPEVTDHPVKEMHIFDRWFVPRLRGRTAERAEIVRELAARRDALRDRAAGGAAAASAVENVDRQHAAHAEVLRIVQAADLRTMSERYAAYFAQRVGPHDRCFGEITPSYALLPPAGYEAILSIYPDARFLFVMRDPVDRLWSATRMQSEWRGSADPTTEFVTNLERRGFIARTTYATTLANLASTVPNGQVLVMFYEDLFGPDDGTLRRLTDFLGVTYVETDRNERYTPGIDVDLPHDLEQWAAQELAATYRYVEASFDRLPERWQEHLALLDQSARRRATSRRRWNAALRRLLDRGLRRSRHDPE